MVVGAHALAWYGRPRYTEDLDLFLNRTAENRHRLEQALREFGVPLSARAYDYLFDSPREMVVLGVEPNAVDLLNFLDGTTFEAAWQNHEAGRLFNVSVPIIGRPEYRATKLASGRTKDLLDLALLDELEAR